MKTNMTERDWVSEVGAPAYASISEMVAAMQADRDRLEELRDERQAFIDEWEEEHAETCPENGRAEWESANPDESTELAELEETVNLDGEEVDEEKARQRIQEDALSVRIFGERVDGEWQADRFELLLATGGPAVRIMGELDANNEPDRAWLEVQDWGKPWTQYFQADQDTLMAYCGCFCFE